MSKLSGGITHCAGVQASPVHYFESSFWSSRDVFTRVIVVLRTLPIYEQCMNQKHNAPYAGLGFLGNTVVTKIHSNRQ